MYKFNFIIVTAVAILISACSSGIEKEAKYPTGAKRSASDDIYEKPASVFGSEGLKIIGNKGKNNNECTGNMGVNAYLWRASLDVISFMPLASADPFGGTITTDWHSDPDNPDERFKVNVYVLSGELRSDAIRAGLFRQVKKGGKWVDATVSEESSIKFEDAILARAREMRVSGFED